MINTYFKDKFPFAYNYFSTLLELVKNKQKAAFFPFLTFLLLQLFKALIREK